MVGNFFLPPRLCYGAADFSILFRFQSKATHIIGLHTGLVLQDSAATQLRRGGSRDCKFSALSVTVKEFLSCQYLAKTLLVFYYVQ